MNRELVTQYSIRESHARSAVRAEHQFMGTFCLDSLDAPEWMPDGCHRGLDGELCGHNYRAVTALGVLRGIPA